ncbi:hypothetical protein B4Q13_19335, partial [Lacticaseibacillus rhamnosus]
GRSKANSQRNFLSRGQRQGQRRTVYRESRARGLHDHSLRVPAAIQSGFALVFLIVAMTLALAVRRSNALLISHAGIERERANLARYFSPNVVEQLSANDEPLTRVHTQDVAVLFADIVGSVVDAGLEHVEAAMRAAQSAADGWQRTRPGERAACDLLGALAVLARIAHRAGRNNQEILFESITPPLVCNGYRLREHAVGQADIIRGSGVECHLQSCRSLWERT